MPYVSDAQRRFFHSSGAAKAGLTKSDVKHWDEASRGQNGLPEHVAKKKHAAFANEVCEILAEKRADMELLAPLIRLKFGPEIHEKIQDEKAKGRQAAGGLRRLLDERPPHSFIERMETGSGYPS